jgi:hypothetical protein
MSMNTFKVVSVIALISSAMLISSAAFAGKNLKGRNSPGSPVVYVISQGLYYDSVVVTDLPAMKGRFQQLIPGELGLMTEFGPGDVGHLGGRWWLDANENEGMDDEDLYFLCPLLGPGRENP